MTYYEVDRPSTTFHDITVAAKTWYMSPSLSIRTWLSLANQGLKTWAKLKALGLTTWKRLGASRWFVTFYYAVTDPIPAFHVVDNPSTTYYEVT